MMQTLPQRVASRLNEAWPPTMWCDAHVLVAVSAGPDSVGMLRALLAAKTMAGGSGWLVAAHLNHQLRGADAEADQAWLQSLCRRLEIPLEVGRTDVAAIADAQGDGLEAAARDARYQFLTQTAERLGARFVAVAHTADDQVETILHRILRGTGLAGLAGMPATRPLSPSVTLVRPLLAVRRGEVLDYLQAIGQDFRVDRTNRDMRWTRNRLRQELLPMLQQYNAGVDEALLRLAAQAAEASDVITALAKQHARECVVVQRSMHAGSTIRPPRAEIDCSKLREIPSLLVREVCRLTWQETQWPMQAMGFDQWQLLAELIQGERFDSLNLPGSLRARRQNDVLIIESIG